MSKIERKTQKIFGVNAPADDIAVMGSFKSGTPVYTDDIEKLQNTAYEGGYGTSLVMNAAPFMEEQNSIPYVLSKQLAYLFQDGIPEYDENTTYYKNSICKVENILYYSTTDDNKGNNPTPDDGTNWEILIEKKDNSGMPIGMIFPMLCSSSYVPDGALPLDGAEYTKALFPNFYTNFLVAGLLNTCTYDEYASDITTYGQCGKFALDTENEKFKVPTIKDGSYLTQALSDTELGKVYNESLPNIQGGIDGFITANYGSLSGTAVTFTGALTGTSTRAGTISGGSNHFQGISNLSLDANKSSSTYQNGAKVQGDNVRVRYFVQVANGQINQSDMDWSAFASALQGKLNKDHSNDEKPYIMETYVNGTSGYRLYSDGWCEQWGRISNNYQGTVTFIKPYKDTNYVLLLSKSDRNENNNGAAWTGLDTSLTNYRTTTQFCYINNQTPNSEWFASGYTA